MIVMPSNNGKIEVGYLAGKYPGRVGWLLSPDGWRTPKPFLPYAVDNGRFKGESWVEADFLKHLDRAGNCDLKPRWVVVPDVYADRDATLREWDVWAPRIEPLGFTLAMVAQDGMTAADIPAGVVCFIGGTTLWKRRNLYRLCEELPRVHVGRINTGRWLWHCHRAGAESCDGTGWFRGDHKQTAGLYRYLERASNGLQESVGQGSLFAESDGRSDSSSDARASNGETTELIPRAQEHQPTSPSVAEGTRRAS